MIGTPTPRAALVRGLGLDRALAAADRDDRAGVEELIGDEDRLIDDAARIVAQVEDERAERVLLRAARRARRATSAPVASTNRLIAR